MSGAILQPPLPRKRFRTSEVEQLLETGFFGSQRFELIDGDFIDKIGQKPPHATAIQLCMAQLMRVFGIELVRVQLPIEAGAGDREWSIPEPDLAVVTEVKRDFTHRHPQGQEIALLVEVADTTFRHDSLRKRDLYAQAGVPEYWVLDLNGRRLLVHRGLNPEKTNYISIRSYAQDEAVVIGESILVSSLLP